MTERTFVDTNVLVYLYDSGHPSKSRAAADLLAGLWREQSGRTSVQVLNELYVTLTRKLTRKMNPDQAWDIVEALLAWNPQTNDRELLTRGRQIEQRYRLSWWDSLVVAAAQLQDCSLLLTEDLQPGMTFGSVRVINPFQSSVKEPDMPYTVLEKLLPRHRARGRPRKLVGVG